MDMKAKLLVFAALLVSFGAAAATKLTVSASGVVLDGNTLADGKLTANTAISEIEISGGTLDLNGFDLSFSGQAGKLSVTGAATITNTASGDAAAISFRLSNQRFGADLFKNVTFADNLRLELSGWSAAKSTLLNSANTHTGGTVLNGYWYGSANQLVPPDIFDANNYARFAGTGEFGTGDFTLKNGSAVVYTGSEDGVQNWAKLVAVNDANNTCTNVLRFENRMVYNGSVEVDASSRLMLASKNRYSVWEADFSKVYGWLGFWGEYSSSLQAKFTGTENVGFPNAHVQIFKPTNAGEVYQLRLNSVEDVPIEIGELSTADTIVEATTNAVVMNVSGSTRTLRVGGLGTDSTFYGDITANGTSHIKLEKTGDGTLTLGGTNKYDLATTLSGGAVKIVKAGVMGNGGDVVFDGGRLAFGADAIDTDYSKRIKNSASPVKVSVDEGGEVVWATALNASNTAGLEKSGAGRLVLSAKPAYTGKTVVSKGSLAIPVDATTLTAENFEIASGAEITYVNTAAYQITDVLGTLGETATVNLLPNGSWRSWRLMEYPVAGESFKGTINFANKGLSATVDGIMADKSAIGNSNVVWGVTGEPDEDNTLLLYIQGNQNSSTTAYLGALRQTSDKGVISIYRHMPAIEIGNRADVDSILNGAWMERQTSGKTTAAMIRKVGAGKLVLGPRFRAISLNDTVLKTGEFADNATTDRTAVYRPDFAITAGEFENNADLTGYNVSLSSGVTLSGTGVWPAAMALPASYSVRAANIGETPETLNIAVDFGSAQLENIPAASVVEELDQTKVYPIFTASSIAGWKPVTVATSSKGRWRIVQNGNSLVLKFCRSGMTIVVR